MKVAVFEFNQKTAPQKRHRLIKEFQESAKPGARVFIVTYEAAAVRITLTAANRVFLMEPCVDPAQEIQACGRIHRLGQEQDCYIRRFAFKDSIEEAVIELHDRIKAGTVKVVDGKVDETASRQVLEAFQKDKVTHDHSGVQREREWSHKTSSYLAPLEEVHGAGFDRTWSYSFVVPPGETQGRTGRQIWTDEEKAYEENNISTGKCKQGACVFYGLFADLPGTCEWSGTGIYEYLNGDKRGPPVTRPGFDAWGTGRLARRFSNVPRPPDGPAKRAEPSRFLSLLPHLCRPHAHGRVTRLDPHWTHRLARPGAQPDGQRRRAARCCWIRYCRLGCGRLGCGRLGCSGRCCA